MGTEAESHDVSEIISPVEQPTLDFAATTLYEQHAVTEEQSQETELSVSPPARRKRLGRGRKILMGVGVSFLLTGSSGYYAQSHPTQTSEFLRNTIGDEKTSWLEGKYFAFEDWKTRKLYNLGFGPDEKPFDTPTQLVTNLQLPEAQPTPSSLPTDPLIFQDEPILIPPEAPKPKPFILPDTHILLSNPLPGEGSWSIDGLPTLPDELTMAKTFIRPDSARPYANVAVMVFDSRRIKLNMVGGKGSLEVGGGRGPGKVPDSDLSNLLVVLNGGFQISHANNKWGAYLDGIEYEPLKSGAASVVVFKDGSIKVGTWGEGELTSRTEDMVAVRQNTVLLIRDGEITPAAKDETNVNIWGKIAATSADFITERSAIGLTKEGHLVIADASSMSALNLARGLQAAGVYTAMQLDINYPWVQTGIVTGHKADGTPILAPFLSSRMDSGIKFLSPQSRDLMYITRDDDSRFK